MRQWGAALLPLPAPPALPPPTAVVACEGLTNPLGTSCPADWPWACPSQPAGLPWPATAAAGALLQQPVSLSQGLAVAAALEQQLQQQQPALGGLWGPPQGGLLHPILEWRADSVRRKRKRAMNRHKHRKRLAKMRMRK